MARKRFTAIPAKFFEECPLYKKFEVTLPERADLLADAELYEPLSMECVPCRSGQSFGVSWREADGWWINHRQEAYTAEAPIGVPFKGNAPPRWHPSPAGDVVSVQFVCTRCQGYRYSFMYLVSDDGTSISKVGQFPRFSILPTEEVRRALGRYAEDYRKGMANESSGFGVGAFAYYRRIVENVIGDLLAQIEELIAEDAERERYHGLLDNVQGSQSAQGRIEAVKDALPATLRPGGWNPLDVLYDALSLGLHAESDEFCLDMAMMVRESLVYLITEIASRRRAGQSLVANLAQIKQRLERHGKRKTDVK
jgi:hypothetical protein